MGAIRFDWYGGSLGAGRAAGVTCQTKETTTVTHWLLKQATAGTSGSARKDGKAYQCGRRIHSERMGHHLFCRSQMTPRVFKQND